MKKRLLTLAMAIVMVLSLVACGGGSSSSSGGAASSAPASSGEVEKKDPIVIDIGHGGSEATAQEVGAQALKAYLEANGNFVVNTHPNNSLGSDSELCQMVQEGTIAMCLANAVIVNYVPDGVIYDMYFRFGNIDEVLYKFNEDEAFLSVMREKYKEAGFYLAGFSTHGFRDTTANKPITAPEDLAGLTFRVQQNDYHILGWQSMGATPTPFAFNELYTALQQGTVDAQENPIELIYSQKFYEQQDYISLTHHQQQVQQWLVGDEFYNSLSDEDREVLDAGIKAATDAATSYALDSEASWKQEIIDYGCQIVELTPEQQQAFKDRIQPQWDKIKEVVSPEVYEAFVN